MRSFQSLFLGLEVAMPHNATARNKVTTEVDASPRQWRYDHGQIRWQQEALDLHSKAIQRPAF